MPFVVGHWWHATWKMEVEKHSGAPGGSVLVEGYLRVRATAGIVGLRPWLLRYFILTDDGTLYRMRKPTSFKEVAESDAIASCRRFSVCTDSPASVWSSLLPRFDLEVRPAFTSSTIMVKLAGDTQNESRRWLEAVATVASYRRKMAPQAETNIRRSACIAVATNEDLGRDGRSPRWRSKPDEEDPVGTVDEEYAGSGDECAGSLAVDSGCADDFETGVPNRGSPVTNDDCLSPIALMGSHSMAYSGCGGSAGIMEGDPT